MAEGVERPAQASWLADAGCDSMQGYLLSPPLPGPDFVTLVSNHMRKAS